MTRASLPQLLPFVPLLAALAWAAVVDVRTRKIRNVLTVTLALAGLVQSLFPAGTVGPVQSTTGLAAGFGLGLVLFLLGGTGGGDVKLLAACGAWLGTAGALQLTLASAVIAMVIVLVQAVRDGQLVRLFHSSAALVTNSLYARQAGGMRQVVDASRSHISIGSPLPFAVPVLLAAVFVVFLRMGVST